MGIFTNRELDLSVYMVFKAGWLIAAKVSAGSLLRVIWASSILSSPSLIPSVDLFPVII